MVNANVVIAVSIPNNYGIAGTSKPFSPKMQAHRWALKREELEPVLDGCGEFRFVAFRHRYLVNAPVLDLADDVDLSSVKELFIIIEGVVHARRDSDGVSWWAEKAFLKKENAEEYAAKHTCSDSYLWVCAVSKYGG